MKRLLSIVVSCALMLCGCGVSETSREISVVATVFPAYDFARAVCGGEDVYMLLDPGTEIHSFEPSPEDILKIENADVFIYTGGDSDTWVEKVLANIDTEDKKIIRMTDHSELIYGHGEEEHTHSAELVSAHEHSHGPDEHVWLSPANAQSIIYAISDALCNINLQSAGVYSKNASEYCRKIAQLADETAEVIKNAENKKIVVADRFPLKYLCQYYSLGYDAAFDACDLLADADAKTVLRLIDTVNNEKLNYVFYIENGSGYLADTVCEETGAEKIMLNSLHSISLDDFSAGITYLDVMEQNKSALERGLG